MSSDLNIAKGLSTEVKALMTDSREYCGRFFLADYAQNHYGEETLLDLLNNAEKQFIPFEKSDGAPVILIRKCQILGLRPVYPNSTQWPRMNNGDKHSWPAAKVIFAEHSLEGCAYTGDMQPKRRRLMDLLNHGNPFFLFETDEGPWIINKNLIKYLEPLA